ncbi:uncharacterized protein [Amphiura filiformis]|uniref:uncharacterized protein n=1 Tax=Amphiura filiformis TaxID=82378 RepID=UPI003B20D0C2
MNESSFNNFVRYHQALAAVCYEVLPSVKTVIEAWHKNYGKKIQQCQTPDICGLRKGDKPTAILGFCEPCILWAKAIEDKYYDPGRHKKSIEWNTIDSTRFYSYNIEVAKAFIHYKQCGRTIRKFEEFTTTDILRLMMHFSDFHKGNISCYENMRNALEVLNSFSTDNHKGKVDSNDEGCKKCIDVVHKLVDSLRQIYPDFMKVIPDVKQHYSKMEVTNRVQLKLEVMQVIDKIILRSCSPLWDSFTEWYQKHKKFLPPCKSPNVCSTLQKPSSRFGACRICIRWGEIIESASESVDALQWDNANPSQFHHDCLEVAKVFAHRLPNDVKISSVHDFQAADVLKIMCQFRVFHQKNPELQTSINEVYQVAISHTKRGCKVAIGQTIAKKMNNFVSKLDTCYPEFLSKEEKSELESDIIKVLDPLDTENGKAYEFNGKMIELVQHISKRGFATWKASLCSGNERADCIAKKVRSFDLEEVRLIQKFDHKNLIKYFGMIDDDPGVLIIMEYADKGDLRSHLDSRNNFLPVSLYHKWVKQACLAVQYLQNRGVVHKDIRSSHFYIMHDDTLKLGNFELVKEMEKTKSTCARASCRWMAPEVVNEQIRSPKSDIFSLGTVIWEITTKQVPFGDMRADYVVMSALVDGKRPPVPSNQPELKIVLMKCWDKKYKKRPSVDYILENVDKLAQEYAKVHDMVQETQPLSSVGQVEESESEDANLCKEGTKPIGEPQQYDTPKVDIPVGHHEHEAGAHSVPTCLQDDDDKLHRCLSIDVDYAEMEKSINRTFIITIAVLNSHRGGNIVLTNKTKVKSVASDHFDNKIRSMLEARKQSENCTIHGSTSDELRRITIAPVQQVCILAFSHVYTRHGTINIEILQTDELVKYFISRITRKFSSLPEELAYRQSILIPDSEADTCEFIDSCEEDFSTCFNVESVAKYVSAFANTRGGRIYFGIDDDGVVNGVLHTEQKQQITDTVDRTMKGMFWLRLGQGSIVPQENIQWRIRFIDVIGTPHSSRRRVVVLTVDIFQDGHVYCKEPQCPILDTKAEGGYRVLTFPEWSSYLQKMHLQREKAPTEETLNTTVKSTHGQSVTHASDPNLDDVSDDMSDDLLETDSAMVRPAVVTAATTLLPEQSVHHPMRNQTLSRADDCNMTIIPETNSSLLQKYRVYQNAKEEYMQKTYHVPKEPPENVEICFTSAPVSEGLQFSSGQSAGALTQNSKLKGQHGGISSDVTIRVKNYTGPIHIIVCLVSEEGTNCLHPNRLVGLNCLHGVYSKHLRIKSLGQPIRLPNVRIARVERQDIGAELDQRKTHMQKICPDVTFHTTKSEEYDLSRVQLRVVGYLPDDRNPDLFIIPLHPITSISLCDKGKHIRKEPRILQMTESKGPVNGGQEVKLVVARTQDDFDVLFSLNITDPPSSWQTIATVNESVQQKSTRLVTINTPAFYKRDMASATQVKVQVRSNGLHSNAITYTYMPSTDGSIDIRMKVSKRKPVYETHFTDVGAACPYVLEYDEKEAKMGQSKKKSRRRTSTNQEAANSENLLAVTQRLPSIIPSRPLPKPKQKTSGAAQGSQQKPKDVSDGASSNETSELLRKYKAFASTHGYKKTAERIENVKEYYSIGADAGATQEEENNLPPSGEEKKEEYVSDWVTSTVSVTQSAQEEAAPEEVAQKIAEEEEMKAIAQGVESTESTEASYKTADSHHDSGSESGGEIIGEYERLLQQKDEESGDGSGGSSSSGTMSMENDHDKGPASLVKAVDDASIDIEASNAEEAVSENVESVQIPQSSEESDILLNDVDWRETLGKGKYGIVYLVMWQEKQAVATKSTNPDVRNVIRSLKKLNHPNIMSTFGLIHKSDESYIVIEYMQCGSLRTMLNEGTSLPSRMSLSLVSQAAHGFAFLHAKYQAHGDVGTHNCFLRKMS